MKLVTPAFCLVFLVSTAWGQFDLKIDQSSSTIMFSVAGGSDSSSLTGQGDMLVTPFSAPLSTARLGGLLVQVADGLNISFAGGLVTVASAPGSIEIELVEPGPAAAIKDGQFSQLGNLFQLTGTIAVDDPLGLAGGSTTIDLSEFEPLAADLVDVDIDLSNQTLTVEGELAASVDAGGLTLQVDANLFMRGAIPTILSGDANQDGVVDLFDVSPFVSVLTGGGFQLEADVNQDGSVNLFDVSPFVGLLVGP